MMTWTLTGPRVVNRTCLLLCAHGHKCWSKDTLYMKGIYAAYVCYSTQPKLAAVAFFFFTVCFEGILLLVSSLVSEMHSQ